VPCLSGINTVTDELPGFRPITLFLQLSSPLSPMQMPRSMAASLPAGRIRGTPAVVHIHMSLTVLYTVKLIVSSMLFCRLQPLTLWQDLFGYGTA
jgi:hypothetical protein